MKNNLLTEIKHIKHLMGINEVSNNDCEIKLEKAGYMVLDKKEQKKIGTDCESKPLIECVKNWLDANMDTSLGGSYEINKSGSKCYLYYKKGVTVTLTSDTKTLDHPEKNFIFYENGQLAYIRSFPVTQIPETDGVEYTQAEYAGKFICESGNLTAEHLKYRGVYEFGKYNKLLKPEIFEIKKADGTSTGKDVNKLVSSHGDFGGTYKV